MSGKLIDKERTLEEEIQLRERAQLQCKQAERTLEDLRMEMHTTAQSKEDLVKQLKQAQVLPSTGTPTAGHIHTNVSPRALMD